MTRTLHDHSAPKKCQAQIHARRSDGQGREFVVLEAFRPIVLHAIEQPEGAAGALYARVSAFAVDERDPTDELGKLSHSLRDMHDESAEDRLGGYSGCPLALITEDGEFLIGNCHRRRPLIWQCSCSYDCVRVGRRDERIGSLR